MNVKYITPILLGIFSIPASANFDGPKPSVSLGVSSMALVQQVKFSNGDKTNTFAGLQLTAAGNLTNHFQMQSSLYRLQYTQDSNSKISGGSFKANFGNGFLSQGFKSYVSVGIFSESYDEGTISERVSGFELGAALGYTFNTVSLDYGFTVRDSSDYQREGLYGNADVIAATGFVNISSKF